MEVQSYRRLFEIEERLWWYHGRRRVCFGLLDRFLATEGSLRILDVGCGTGLNLQYLGRYGDAQGVDMSPEALDFCLQRGVESVVLHTAERLPFKDSTFDLVTAFDVIEHIEDDLSALAEFHRILKPGGHLLVYTPALPWLFDEHDRLVHHKRRYLLGDLKAKLSQSGFTERYLSYVNFLVLPIVLLAKLVFALAPRRRHREMEVPPEPVNGLLTQICYLEEKLLRRFPLPVGLSLVGLVKRPTSRR